MGRTIAEYHNGRWTEYNRANGQRRDISPARAASIRAAQDLSFTDAADLAVGHAFQQGINWLGGTEVGQAVGLDNLQMDGGQAYSEVRRQRPGATLAGDAAVDASISMATPGGFLPQLVSGAVTDYATADEGNRLTDATWGAGFHTAFDFVGRWIGNMFAARRPAGTRVSNRLEAEGGKATPAMKQGDPESPLWDVEAAGISSRFGSQQLKDVYNHNALLARRKLAEAAYGQGNLPREVAENGMDIYDIGPRMVELVQEMDGYGRAMGQTVVGPDLVDSMRFITDGGAEDLSEVIPQFSKRARGGMPWKEWVEQQRKAGGLQLSGQELLELRRYAGKRASGDKDGMINLWKKTTNHVKDALGEDGYRAFQRTNGQLEVLQLIDKKVTSADGIPSYGRLNQAMNSKYKSRRYGIGAEDPLQPEVRSLFDFVNAIDAKTMKAPFGRSGTAERLSDFISPQKWASGLESQLYMRTADNANFNYPGSLTMPMIGENVSDPVLRAGATTGSLGASGVLDWLHRDEVE